MATLLEVADLHVAYGKVEAVHGVSLRVEDAQIVTVIGPNGAGKTTLLAAIMGLLPSRGSMSYAGNSLNTIEVEQRVARGLTLVPERRELFAAMTVADNLLLGAFQRFRAGEKTIAATQDEIYQRFPRLAERRAQLAGTLSGGERQMLALCRALMAKPRLLMRRSSSRKFSASLRRSRRPACRYCWWSRTRALRCKSPTTGMYWKPARWRWRAPAVRSRPMRALPQPISVKATRPKWAL